MTRGKRLSALVYILVAVACCFLDVRSEESDAPSEEGAKITFNDEQNAKIQSAKTKLLAVTAIAEGMSENSRTRPLVSSKNFRGKIEAAKAKVENIQRELLGEDDAEGKAERISGALSGVGEGLMEIIQGYQDGDWVQAVQGALGNSTL